MVATQVSRLTGGAVIGEIADTPAGKSGHSEPAGSARHEPSPTERIALVTLAHLDGGKTVRANSRRRGRTRPTPT
jgi:hypothetical protein